jgi:uracil-DNA glycosylase family 4
MKKAERQAVTRLIDTFGADIAISLRNKEDINSGERLKRRLACEGIIENCHACSLRAEQGTPLTPFWSPPKLRRPGRIAVLGDAPTIEEHRAGELGRGPLYRTIHSTLRDSGIIPERITYLTTVFCTPMVQNKNKRGATRVPPARENVQACESNVTRALHAADVAYVLLLGGHATRAWRPDMHLANVAGKWFTWRNKWMVFPVEHPSVVLTRTKSGKDIGNWYEQIRRFAMGVGGDIGLEGLSTACIMDCGQKFYAWDDDGVGWCQEHFKPNRVSREDRTGTRKPKDTAQGMIL